MTKAYIMGFCKTAEAYGVDPDKLVKVANKLNGVKTLASLVGEPIIRGGKEIARPVMNLSKIRKGLASGTLPEQVRANFQTILDASHRVKKYDKSTRSLLKRLARSEGAPASKIKQIDAVPPHVFAGPRAMVGTTEFASGLEQELARGGQRLIENNITPQQVRTAKKMLGGIRQNSEEAKSILDFLKVPEADRAAIRKDLWKPVTKKPVGPKIKRKR